MGKDFDSIRSDGEVVVSEELERRVNVCRGMDGATGAGSYFGAVCTPVARSDEIAAVNGYINCGSADAGEEEGGEKGDEIEAKSVAVKLGQGRKIDWRT